MCFKADLFCWVFGLGIESGYWWFVNLNKRVFCGKKKKGNRMLNSPSTSVIRYFLCGYFKIYVKAHKIGRGQIFKSRKIISIQGVICHCFCVYLPCYAHDNCNYNGNLYSSNYCCDKDMRKLLSAWDNVKNTKVCLFTVLSSVSWFTPAKQKEYFLESVIW